MPASMAPSTTSWPNRAAITSSRNSSTTDQRSMTCPVAFWPSLMIVRSRSLRTMNGTAPSATASSPTAATDSSAAKWLPWVRKTAMATIGNSSPTAPAANT